MLERQAHTRFYAPSSTGCAETSSWILDRTVSTRPLCLDSAVRDENWCLPACKIEYLVSNAAAIALDREHKVTMQAKLMAVHTCRPSSHLPAQDRGTIGCDILAILPSVDRFAGYETEVCGRGDQVREVVEAGDLELRMWDLD